MNEYQSGTRSEELKRKAIDQCATIAADNNRNCDPLVHDCFVMSRDVMRCQLSQPGMKGAGLVHCGPSDIQADGSHHHYSLAIVLIRIIS